MYIRYNKLNEILCTIDGTFTSHVITIRVKWNDNSVSLFNTGYTYDKTNFKLAALQYAVTAEEIPAKVLLFPLFV